ncbi:MAG: hypothetical protein NC822_00235 [Candidatus Omnitrophica bacterium]|nr:hypothetical protein [Candidatus Omnitrophota bacterium]
MNEKLKNDIFKFPKAQIYSPNYIRERVNWLNKYLGINLYYIARSLDERKNLKDLLKI